MLELADKSFSKKGSYSPQDIITEFKTEDPFKLVENVLHINEVKE